MGLCISSGARIGWSNMPNTRMTRQGLVPSLRASGSWLLLLLGWGLWLCRLGNQPRIVCPDRGASTSTDHNNVALAPTFSVGLHRNAASCAYNCTALWELTFLRLVATGWRTPLVVSSFMQSGGRPHLQLINNKWSIYEAMKHDVKRRPLVSPELCGLLRWRKKYLVEENQLRLIRWLTENLSTSLMQFLSRWWWEYSVEKKERKRWYGYLN